MKSNFIALSFILLIFCPAVLAQQNPKEAMEKAMQNLTPQQREQMQKMMGNIPATMNQNTMPARYPEFTSNKELLYKRDIAKINAIPKKKLTQADMSAYAGNLYNKIMTKGEAGEIALVKKITAQVTGANELGNAAIVCMMQGHPQAAMALSMKAVQVDPANSNWQNNMASLLTQYGYPELAVPVLQKLRNEFQDNSTVLNNLAQAWFSLGETDSAFRLSMAASSINPLNADAQLCGGIIEESRGNTEKATEHYTRAFENSPNSFAEKVLRNKAGQNGINNIDYEKLLNNLTIYAYFPKDWFKIPELSDKVAEFEDDRGTQTSYIKMFHAFTDELKKAIDLSEAESKKAMANPGEMINEALKHGSSFISTPARIINTLIILKIQKISLEYKKEEETLLNYVKEKLKEKNNAGAHDDCGATDKRNNAFLADVNPKIRTLYSKYIEEYRIWLNAYCTWTWYLTGNIKNTSLTMCLNFTKFFKDMCLRAVEMQKTEAPCGIEGLDYDRNKPVIMPNIPKFTCPTVVAVPLGMDWQLLDNTLKNLDANSLGIKKAAGVPVPNVTIVHGAANKSIAQPGIAPFTQTSNGDLLPEYSSDWKNLDTYEEMYGEDLAPLAPDKTALEKAIDKNLGKLLKKRLQKMMVDNCDDLISLKESDKKKAWEEKVKKLEEVLEEDYENKRMKKEVEEIKNNRKITDAYLKGYVDEVFNNMQKPGSSPVTPALSSSPQAPGTFTPQRNLFQ